MNNIDKQYKSLLQDILDNGVGINYIKIEKLYTI
jgi:hypothetical protein